VVQSFIRNQTLNCYRQKTESNALRRTIVPKGKKQKAVDHERHMRMQRDKELKRKERRNAELPANITKARNRVRE